MILTPQQIEARRASIGSSDAINIVNGDWLEVWQSKKGVDREFSPQQMLNMKCGDALEPVIIEEYARITDETPLFHQATVINHHGVPLSSNPDAITVSGVGIEAKAHGGYKDLEELATFYYPQLQHHMLVHEKSEWDLAVIWGQFWKFDYVTIARNQEFIEHYVQQCKAFWAYVTDNIQPPALVATGKAEWIPNPQKICYDMTKSNAFSDAEYDYIQNVEAQAKFETAKKSLKELMPEDADYAFGTFAQIKRAKNGNILIAPLKETDKKSASNYAIQKEI